MSTLQISYMYNVTHNIVRDHLIRNGIEIRGMSEAQRALYGKEPISDDVKDYDIMYDQYINKNMTLKELGEKYSCTAYKIKECLEKLGITIRTQSEAKLLCAPKGESHPNWKGGITPLHMRLREFHNENLAPLAKQRDKFRCQLCGSHNNLHSHHIKSFSSILNEIIEENNQLDPVKNANELYDIITNDKRFLDIDNLITYCKDCHLFKIHKYNRKISSQTSNEEGSTTISKESTLQAFGNGNGETPIVECDIV